MSHLNYKIISDPTEAEAIWNVLSPKKNLYDDWDFRYAYYKYFNYPLYFYTAYDENEPVGLLPLMWDVEKGYLDFFAGFQFMEDNTIYIKDGFQSVRENLLQIVQKPALLDYMNEDMSRIDGVQFLENAYYIELEGIKNYYDYIEQRFTGKTKNTIKRQLKQLFRNDIQFVEDRRDDVSLLIKFNKDRFGKDSSFYTRPHWEDFYNSIVSQFNSKTISVVIDNEVKAVGLGILYNDTYVMVNSGADLEFSNLRKFTSLFLLDQAIQLGAKVYDAGSGAFGWKEDLRLSKKPQYILDLRNK